METKHLLSCPSFETMWFTGEGGGGEGICIMGKGEGEENGEEPTCSTTTDILKNKIQSWYKYLVNLHHQTLKTGTKI